MRYREAFKITSFIDRVLSKRETGTRNVLRLLQSLESSQNINPWITFVVATGGGIRVLWKGEELFAIWPAVSRVRLFWHDPHPQTRKLEKHLDSKNEADGVAPYIVASSDHARRGWYICFDSLKIISEFISELPKPSLKLIQDVELMHPRYFSGEERARAYEEFKLRGMICPGYKRKSHRVNLKRDRIEFDHIIPYALGGASVESNLQVLCSSCNRQKGATVFGNATPRSKELGSDI